MTNSNDPGRYWNIWGHYVRAPSAKLQALQAKLMASAFTWAEKRKIPGLTLGFAQHKAAIKLAVGQHSVIANRMSRCGSVDEHGNRRECSVTLCPRCIMLRRGRQTAENRELFAHLGNEGLAFMTVLVKVIDNLDDADDLMAEHELKIHNAIRNRRPKDARWNDVYVKGYWELEHYRDNEDLGHNEARTLPALGYPEIGFGDSVWLLHCHAIVALGEISIDELKHALRSKSYDKAFQVDIRPFEAHRDVIENIKRTTRYSMKFRIEDDYKRTEPYDPEYVYDIEACNDRKWWPKAAVADLANYLCKPRGGFQAMQFWVGPKGVSKTKVISKKSSSKKVDGKTDQSQRPVIKEIIEKIIEMRTNGMSSDVSDAMGFGSGGSESTGDNRNNEISLHDTNWLKRWVLDYRSRKPSRGDHDQQQHRQPHKAGF